MKKLLLTGLLLSFSTPGRAVFDAQVLLGGANVRSTAVSTEPDKSANASGSQAGLSLHFDPFPAVPVSFGAIYLNQGFAVDNETHKSTSFAGAIVGPEIMAWVPTGASLAPYLKAAYALVGYGKKFDSALTESASNMEFQSEKKESTLLYSGSGPRAAAGVNWAAFRYVSFMAEYSMTWSKIKATKLEDGVTGETRELKDSPSEALHTQGLMFGVGGNI